ncbi:alcohol dehydrogenase catalytic domain-containing protein, partial [Undibacterium sp. CCC2.1]
MTPPLTMQALLVDFSDAPLRLTQLPMPIPEAGQVLVRIKASGVNPLDTKIRTGKAAHARQPLPAVLGMDLAGVVHALGPG